MSKLAEDLALLLLDDATGRSAVDVGRRYRSVGGAILVDLILQGRASVTVAEKTARVEVPNPTDTGDPVLDAAQRWLAPKPQKVGWAAENLGHDLWKPLLTGLVENGVLRAERGRALGIIPVTTFPAADGDREAAVRADIRAALVDGTEPADHTALLITLLHGIGAIGAVLGDAGDAAAQARAEQIARSTWAAGPLRDAFHGLDNPALITVFVS